MTGSGKVAPRHLVAETGSGLAFCRHCGKDTNSAKDILEVGGVRYEVMYCSECHIAGSAFRLSRDGRREGPADGLMLRRLHKPAPK